MNDSDYSPPIQKLNKFYALFIFFQLLILNAYTASSGIGFDAG